MNTSRLTIRSLGLALLLLALSSAATAQDIYKCTQGGTVAYTDRPCPQGKGELLHKADDTEIIDEFLRLGEPDKAQTYAKAHHLEALYEQRLTAYQQQQDAKAKQQAADALAAKQNDEQARQQARDNQLSNRSQLEAQNDALRQQNALYRNQLSQPVENYSSSYWGSVPSYVGQPHQHDGAHGKPTPPSPPVFHPCTSLAGGRVQC